MTTASQTVKGVISRRKKAPVEVTDIVIPEPGDNDVIVAIKTCGLCHTDMAYRDGGITDDYPFLLGHEATAVVDHIGPRVTHVAEGDTVVLNWRAVCGECRACQRGEQHLCFNTFNASKPMTLTNGTKVTPALGIGAFAEKTLVHEKQCTKVDPDVDPAAAGLLGCGVMAGLGAAVNTGEIKAGESVAVIGAGGVGMAAIAGAVLAGATTVIAIDLSDGKLTTAKEFGATHTINPSTLTASRDEDDISPENQPVVNAVKALTNGFGVDVAIDAVGSPQTFTQAFYMRDLAGRVILVGVPTPDMTLELPFVDLFSHGGAIKPSWYGDCLPERDFPRYVTLFQQGKFPLDKFVTERIGMSEVEDGFETMKNGNVLRSVMVV
ncbi:S-(hydroxymethyl)mycothiol dehydrogenase [Corynebacterium kroppenstedtii]|uniref:S-(hydroxymethyl)mycothiol dehydrogenase n=1 Tax=Corynebacterium sp. PCR 32 TaxID=3351342 RepID=UPI00309604C8